MKQERATLERRKRRPGVVPGGNVLDAHQTGAFLGAHVETVRRMARRGDLPAYKVGRDWRFSKTALRDWAESHYIRRRPPLVLVVDDEKSFRDTTRIFLERGSFRVKTAANGEVATEAARREMPDMVLLDLVMPGMNGVDVLRELHRMDPDLPVVVVTAYPDSEMMSQVLQYSPVTLLPKPLDKSTLLKTVKRVLVGSGVRGQ